jgi:hypothetical protein
MSTYDLGILSTFLPSEVKNSYLSAGDFFYKLLNDKYFLRAWDICGLTMALGASFLFYFSYQFLIEIVKTLML